MAQSSHAFLVNDLRDHAVVGNGRTAWLVKKSGAVDFACAPDFDSPSVFLSLHDSENGGAFSYISDQEEFRQWSYRDETAVLETLATSADAAYMTTDFMDFPERAASVGATRGGKSRFYRLFECTRGTVRLKARVQPAFDYARAEASHEVSGPHFRFFTTTSSMEGRFDGTESANAIWKYENGAVTIEFELSAGDGASIVIDAGERSAAVPLPDVPEVRQALERTAGEWRGWSAMCAYRGEFRSDVVRSAIVAKLLSYSPTGAVLSAVTLDREKDDRFTSLLHAASLAKTFVRLGYKDEAKAYMEFLRARYNEERSPTQPWVSTYSIHGGALAKEEQLPLGLWLGTRANDQIRLILAGEVLEAIQIYSEAYGKSMTEAQWNDWREIVLATAHLVTENWRTSEGKLWGRQSEDEKPQAYVFSKVMAWVALESALKLAADIEVYEARVLLKWRTVKEEIRDEIRRSGLHTEKRTFAKAFGSSETDATLLLIATNGFLDAKDPTLQATVARIENELAIDGWVHREPASLEPGSRRAPADVSCSFWLMRNQILQGHFDRALSNYEEMRAGANELGLYSESLDAETGEWSGSFPSLAAHLAQILALQQLEDARRAARQNTKMETKSVRPPTATESADRGE